jgi:hypothetical protein
MPFGSENWKCGMHISVKCVVTHGLTQSVRTSLFVRNCSYKTVRTRRVIVKYMWNIWRINFLMINHCTHASRELIIRINKLSWPSYWKKHLNCCNTTVAQTRQHKNSFCIFWFLYFLIFVFFDFCIFWFLYFLIFCIFWSFDLQFFDLFFDFCIFWFFDFLIFWFFLVLIYLDFFKCLLISSAHNGGFFSNCFELKRTLVYIHLQYSILNSEPEKC